MLVDACPSMVLFRLLTSLLIVAANHIVDIIVPIRVISIVDIITIIQTGTLTYDCGSLDSSSYRLGLMALSSPLAFIVGISLDSCTFFPTANANCILPLLNYSPYLFESIHHPPKMIG